MTKATLTLIDDAQARELAQAAYDRTLASYVGAEAYRYTSAYAEAKQAVIRAYPANTFCVVRERAIHQAIRKQAREAANAAVGR